MATLTTAFWRVTAQCSAVQCSAVQYSTVQYCTVQYCTVRYSHSLECSHQSGYPGWLRQASAAKKAAVTVLYLLAALVGSGVSVQRDCQAAAAKKAGRIILICSVLYMLPQRTPTVD